MVYLADDDIDDIEIVQDAFSRYSYKGPVNASTNGQMLLDLLVSKVDSMLPDVILLDLNMPLKDGFQTLKEIKNNPTFKTIPVIVLTASSRKEDEIKCKELGCDYFFTKPTRMNDYSVLVTLVKKIVSK